MAQIGYPFSAGAGANVTEDQWWRMGQMWAPDGVLSTAGGGRGATGSELLVFGDGSGFRPKVSEGQAWVKGVYYENDATLTLPDLATADATNPRIDVVAIRINWLTDTASIVVVPGTPGVTPAVPPLAGTPGNQFDMMLALVNVAAGATSISAGNVRDARVYTDLAQRIPVGAMLDWPTTAAPFGWLLCGGQAVDRVKYRTLFTLLGTSFGIGDNVTTFNLPDLRGRIGVGLDNMGGLGAASRVPSAAGVGTSFAGGTELHTMTAGDLVNHVHTGGSLVATGGGASNGHVHNVDPPATNSGTINQTHTHTVASFTATTDGTDDHHTHVVPALSGTANNDNQAHSHPITSLSGTTSTTAHQHNVSGAVAGGQALTGIGTAFYTTGTQTTDPESPAHAHTVSLTGNTGNAASAHTHPVTTVATTSDFNSPATGHAHGITIAVPNPGTGVENQGHVHAVDIAAFDSADQSLNHTHNTTISGNTGGTGSTTAFSVMQPYLVVGKIIKF